MRDKLFRSDAKPGDFEFNADVAAVFDDMVTRSVPFYREVQRMVAELAAVFLQDSGTFYDIGCSTGTTLAAVAKEVPPDSGVRLVGLEPSAAMREQATQKLSATADLGSVELLPHRVEEVDDLPDARMICMLYTLQFVRPAHRPRVLEMCCQSLRSGGCLILGEKILADEPSMRRLFIDLYHEYKRRSGYSAMEIARKREALENVLVPFTGTENVELLRNSGFSTVDRVFHWYNFAVFLAVKEGDASA